MDFEANYDSVKYDKKRCIHFLNTDKQELITEYFLHVYLSKEITNKKNIYTVFQKELYNFERVCLYRFIQRTYTMF
jgi:hypothetical protein